MTTIKEQVSNLAAELKQHHEQQVQAGYWDNLAVRVMLMITLAKKEEFDKRVESARKSRDIIKKLLNRLNSSMFEISEMTRKLYPDSPE